MAGVAITGFKNLMSGEEILCVRRDGPDPNHTYITHALKVTGQVDDGIYLGVWIEATDIGQVIRLDHRVPLVNFPPSRKAIASYRELIGRLDPKLFRGPE